MPDTTAASELLKRFGEGDERAGREIRALGTAPSTANEVIDELLDGLAEIARSQPDAGATDPLIEILYAQPFLRSEILRILMRDVEAEEALQDALLSIARGLPRFRGDAKVRTWARRVAHNAAVGQLRRRRETTGTRHDVADDPGEITRFSSALANRADVQAALAALPVEFEEIVRLRDLEHLTYEQIADRLELNIGTVRSRLARGRGQLAVLLDHT